MPAATTDQTKFAPRDSPLSISWMIDDRQKKNLSRALLIWLFSLDAHDHRTPTGTRKLPVLLIKEEAADDASAQSRDPTKKKDPY
jgi:hypothetical protein